MASAELDREYHDVIGGEYDAVVVAPRRVINDIILGAAADLIAPGDKMIDVGCGTGHASLRLARKFTSVVAIDHSTAMLAAAEKKSGCRRHLECPATTIVCA